MAMEITNDYIGHALQSMEKSNAAAGTNKEMEQTAKECADSQAAKVQKTDWAVVYSSSLKSQSLADYARELAKLAPSVQVKVGGTFSSAKSGKTLTLDPGLLNKMQHDPKMAKDMKDMIKGVEFITKFVDGLYKSSGKMLVYRHSFIDADGKYRCISRVKDGRSYQMSVKLRQKRQKNSQKLIAKSRDKALKSRKTQQKKTQAKRMAKTVGRRVDVKL